MAIARKAPVCPRCGEPYKAINKEMGPTFVGDTFVTWDTEKHVCKQNESNPISEYKEILDPRFRKENRPAIEKEMARQAEESQKFKEMFVDWELSKRLKVAGFDEPCFAYFWMHKDTFNYTVRYENHNRSPLKAAAPLLQQVLEWFDSKRIFIDVDHEFGVDWSYCVDTHGNGHSGNDVSYTSRKIATLKAINKALKIYERILKKSQSGKN